MRTRCKSGRKSGRKTGRRGGYYPETDISPQLVNQQSYPVGSLLHP